MKKFFFCTIFIVTILFSANKNVSAAEFDIEDQVLLAAQGDEAEITVPSGVTEIADRAFAGNKSVTRIYIPEGVVSIGAYAFKGCSSLDVVLLPSTIESIGDDAFSGCKELLMVGYVEGTKKSIINWLIDNEMQYQLYSGKQDRNVVFNDIKLLYPQLNEILSKDGIVYKVVKKTKKNMAVVVCGCNKERKTFKIPSSITFQRKTYKVTGIVKAAFKNHPKLQKVVVGKNVKKIENSAFVKCRRLSLIIIKNKECKYSEKIVKKSGKCKIKVAE